MKVLVLIILVIFICDDSHGQIPGKIEINFPDTVNERSDVRLKVLVSGNNGAFFELPEKKTFGILTTIDAIFQVSVQKLQDAYQEYFSNFVPGESHAFSRGVVQMIRYKNYQFENDLGVVGTLDSGSYRMKIYYNKPLLSGRITDPDFVLESEWHYFYVRKSMYLY